MTFGFVGCGVGASGAVVDVSIEIPDGCGSFSKPLIFVIGRSGGNAFAASAYVNFAFLEL